MDWHAKGIELENILGLESDLINHYSQSAIDNFRKALVEALEEAYYQGIEEGADAQRDLQERE